MGVEFTTQETGGAPGLCAAPGRYMAGKIGKALMFISVNAEQETCEAAIAAYGPTVKKTSLRLQ